MQIYIGRRKSGWRTGSQRGSKGTRKTGKRVQGALVAVDLRNTSRLSKSTPLLSWEKSNSISERLAGISKALRAKIWTIRKSPSGGRGFDGEVCPCYLIKISFFVSMKSPACNR
jgi:hypothetical protein